ncbi:MAG: hypothetical protein KDD00_05500 [Ignavibacteriae bacterium]|nr:hypothetical protein [Ignavibacteriota bacterium]
MKTTLKKMILLIELIFLITIYGCTGGWWESHVHMDLYEELNSNKIKTIAVFPIRISKLDSNEIADVNEYFMNGIKKILNNYELKSQAECMEKLKRDSLAKKYNQLSGIYTKGLSLDKLIEDAGKSIGCDAIVLTEIYITNTFVTVIYTFYSTNNVKLLFVNSVETNIYEDLKSSPTPIIRIIKADIDRLLKYTYR